MSKPDANWRPLEAYRKAHPRYGRVAERLKPYLCMSCHFEDKGWTPVEPPAPGWSYVFKCPKCGSFMEQQERVGRMPDDLPMVWRDFGGFQLTNAGHEPVYIRGREHYKQVLKERGLMNVYGEGAG